MSIFKPVTVITGASAGIGRSLAKIFAAHGHEVALVARRDRELHELAQEIAANSPYGVWMTKQVLGRSVDAPSLDAAIDMENRTQVLGTRTEDSLEAMHAFRDRRPARFVQR